MSHMQYKCTRCGWGGFATPGKDPGFTWRSWQCPTCLATYDLPAGTSSESDPHGTDAHAPGAKLDAGKNRVWLCVAGFSRAIEKVAEVTTKGAEKYTPNGWMEVPDGAVRYMDAFGRHALKLGSGEAIDPDTGCMHKAQMIWNLLASMELELRAETKVLDA